MRTRDEYTIVRAPLLSEKGSDLGESQNQYFFRVAVDANKIEIKRAVERLYKVKVAGVNTMRMSGKRKQLRRKVGRKPDWKKAIVTLKQGHSIEFV
ncbi:MAG: 50S ribosomal protein L23 [Verrucomicrobia bacterium]|nr:50S ribosomal protein L23 [Verrucomicrobiota bacterium]